LRGKIKALIKIARPGNFLITILSVLGGGFIALQSFSGFPFADLFAASLAAGFIAAAGNIINDYYDFEIDKINRPERPLVSGEITKRAALKYYIALNGLGFLFAGYISLTILAIVLITASLLFVYSFKLKRVPFAGNLLVAFLTGFVFIYAGIAAGNAAGGIIPFFFAFLINLMRELVKDIEDYEGDSVNKIKTVPIVKGISFTRKIISALILLLIISSPLPFFYFNYNFEFLLLILFLIDLPLVNIFIRLNSDSPDYRKLSLQLKTLMILGLGILIIGVL